MRAFPPAEGLNFLIGLELFQICLDPWSVQFRFHPQGQITVESRFEHITADGVTHGHDTADRVAHPLFLYELIQQSIEQVNSEPEWLTLTFANNAKLRIFAEIGSGYESGQIFKSDDRRFCIVF
jgi:hypothetical protein